MTGGDFRLYPISRSLSGAFSAVYYDPWLAQIRLFTLSLASCVSIPFKEIGEGGEREFPTPGSTR